MNIIELELELIELNKLLKVKDSELIRIRKEYVEIEIDQYFNAVRILKEIKCCRR